MSDSLIHSTAMKDSRRRIADTISTIIAYAVIAGPIIILVIVMVCSYFGKIKSVIEDSPLFEKKVYYTNEDKYYHDSKDCPALQQSEHNFSAYKNELPGRVKCEQCSERR